MKKVAVVLAVIALTIALGLWVISWFRAPQAVATSGSRAWPGGMGTLESLAERSPRVNANEASLKLEALGAALPRNEAVETFIDREIGSGKAAVGEAPALPDVSRIRELLLSEPMTWEYRYEVGDADTSNERGLQMTMARALVATALAKARLGDWHAWDDLNAVWRLARSLDGNPQMMVQTAALSMARMVNAVAWKMPLPPPEWLNELQSRDHVRPLLEAYQHQTAAYWQDGDFFPTKWLADSVEHDRKIAEALFSLTLCDVDTTMNKLGTDLSAVWRRAFRYRAEKEATANALRIRAGTPVETRSACSDGSWTYDGKTLRFSREIAPPPTDLPVPLVLQVVP